MYYDELAVGQRAEFTKTIDESDVALFAQITGDFNPVHLDEPAAANGLFGTRVVHGMLSASLLCAVYGMQLPGPGAIHLQQQLRFRAPIRIGDTVTAHVEVLELLPRRRVRVRSWCSRQDGVLAVEGEALLIAAARPGNESTGLEQPPPDRARTVT